MEKIHISQLKKGDKVTGKYSGDMYDATVYAIEKGDYRNTVYLARDDKMSGGGIYEDDEGRSTWVCHIKPDGSIGADGNNGILYWNKPPKQYTCKCGNKSARFRGGLCKTCNKKPI
jgi:hypothetical protein